MEFLMKSQFLTAFLIITIVKEVVALTTTIEKAYIDASENVHIVLTTGKDNQLTVDGRCEDLKFDKKQQVLGWVQRGTVEDDKGNVLQEFRAAISIYKDGRFGNTITTDQTIWNWKFLDNGKKIVYGSGPTHGGESFFCMTLRAAAPLKIVGRFQIVPIGPVIYKTKSSQRVIQADAKWSVFLFQCSLPSPLTNSMLA